MSSGEVLKWLKVNELAYWIPKFERCASRGFSIDGETLCMLNERSLNAAFGDSNVIARMKLLAKIAALVRYVSLSRLSVIKVLVSARARVALKFHGAVAICATRRFTIDRETLCHVQQGEFDHRFDESSVIARMKLLAMIEFLERCVILCSTLYSSCLLFVALQIVYKSLM